MASKLRGRMPDISPAIVTKLAALVSTHIYPSTVADAAGLSRRTLNRWLAAGRKAQGKRDAGEVLDEREDMYVTVAAAFASGHAAIQAECLQGITAAGKNGTWQAQAWMLERVWHEQYGQGRQEVKALRAELADARKQMRELLDRIEGMVGGAGGAGGSEQVLPMPPRIAAPDATSGTPDGGGAA